MRSFIRSVRTIFWVVRLVFRFFSGRPMSGQRKTDATFWRPARQSLDPSGTALRWEMMRGASRAAWRVGALYLVCLSFLLPIVWLTEKAVSLPWYLSFSFLLWGHLLLLGGAGGGWALRRYIKAHGCYLPSLAETEEGKKRISLRKVDGVLDWRREKILPVAHVVSTVATCHIPDRKAHEWVLIPKNFREGGTVQIRLPGRFTGADEGVKRRLVSSVSAKLGVPGMLPSWALEGSAPSLHLVAPPAPPDKIFYSDVEKYLLASEEYRPFLGVDGGDSPFLAEMIDDSPHIALSAGPGAGKSTMAKLVAMQALRWGWGVVVLDWKQSNAFSWMGGLQGVTYLSKIEQIHDMGVRIAEEIDIRKENGMGGRAKVLVIRDEWNATADLLKAYWDDLRSTADSEEKKTMPVKSPALRGFATLDFAGREYGLFDFCIAQRFSARVFNGNADIRECFNIKLLARYSSQTQKMLAPDIKPFPRKSNIRGRWTTVVGDEASVIQSPFITNEQARAYASGGADNPLSPFTSTFANRPGATSPVADDTQEDQLLPGQPGATSGSSQEHLFVVPLKLSEMVERLTPLGITLNILQKAAGDKDSGFPSPVSGSPNRGYRYEFKAVREWARMRHSRIALEKIK